MSQLFYLKEVTPEMSSSRDSEVLEFFNGRNMLPVTVAHRHDGTSEFTWRVDDCPDRYVRAMSSVCGGDWAAVSRDLRAVESAVLGDGEIFDWVSAHLAELSKSRLSLVP